MTQPARTRAPIRYGAWTLAATAVGLAGYTGYVLYPRFDVPAGVGLGVLMLAAAAGIASFFSPCSFPLLASMLARPLAVHDLSRGQAWSRALAYASALSVGAAGFLGILGGLLAIGTGTLFEDVTFTSTAGRALRVIIGTGLVIFGLVQSGRISMNLRRFEPGLHRALRGQAELRRRRPFAGFVVFGFLYLLAGFG